jgi:hypothetical protein
MVVINIGDVSTGPLAPDPPGQAEFEEWARTGLTILLGLGALVLIELGLLVLYAWGTYPDSQDFVGLQQPMPTDAADVMRQARSDWIASIKDLGQLFLITPLFSLIGVVIGYIFGHRE